MVVKILNVLITKGSEWNDNWKSDMQFVITDKGMYIDNMPGKNFSNSPISWKAPVWRDYIKSRVEIEVVQSRGYAWIKPIDLKDKS